MHGHMGFGLGFLNFVGTILFFVAVFWALKFFLRGGCRSRGRYPKWRSEWRRGWPGGGRPWESGSDEADRVLRERLAKGEIGEDEYARLKGQLGRNGASTGGANGGGGRFESSPLGWLRGDDALELARLRLARGEISADEFETIRRVLTS
jgi:hypothetical protein